MLADATDAMDVYQKVLEVSKEPVDVTINVVNVPNTEMSCILITKDTGVVYFFSMATSFTKAALGAEGVGGRGTDGVCPPHLRWRAVHRKGASGG